MEKFEEILAGIPQEIKTLEVDVEKKVFRLNGIDFAEGCDFFSVSCEGGKDFKVRMELDKRIACASYNFWSHKREGEIELFEKK